MEPERIVLELGPAHELLRVGKALEMRGATWTVEWPDGARESVQLGTQPSGIRYEGAPSDSLRHRLIVDRPGLEPALRNDPPAVFVAILRHALRPMAPSDMRKALIEAHFDATDVDLAWKRAAKVFEHLPEVETLEGGRTRQFRLKAGEPSSPATGQSAADRRSVVAPPSTSPSRGEPSVRRDAQASSRPDSDQATPRSASKDAAEPSRTVTPPSRVVETRSTAVGVVADESSGDSATARDPESDVIPQLRRLARGQRIDDVSLRSAIALESPALQAVFAALNGDEPTQHAVFALKRPLSSGLELARLSDETLSRTLEHLADRTSLLFLALPRALPRLDQTDLPALAQPGVGDALLLAALHEYGQSRNDRAGDRARALSWLVDRSLSRPSAGDLRFETLREISSLDLPLTPHDRPELVARALARSVEKLGADGWHGLSPSVRNSIAIRASKATLAGGRGLLLRAVHQVDPDTVLQPIWWRGVTTDDLLEAADGPLAAVLTDPSVQAAVVRPQLQESLETAISRRRVMQILGSPRSIAQTADSVAVARALARVASGSDELLGAWLSQVRDDDGRAQLESRVNDLINALAELEAQLGREHERAKAAEARVSEFDDRLRHAGERTELLRAAQTRQVQIDVMRSYARLSSLIVRAIREHRTERVLSRIESMAAREGLVVLGRPGEVVPYTPVEHDLVGAPLDAGVPVVVRHEGYTWTGPEGEVVLVRAEVEREG